MSIIVRKFDGNPFTSGGFSAAPTIDDVSDDMVIVKRLVFELGILDFVGCNGFIQPEVCLEANNLQRGGTRSCLGDGCLGDGCLGDGCLGDGHLVT
jgi:hypothetical protein